MDSGPTGLDTRVKQANKQPKTNTRSKVGEWREKYLQASPMADADDTGICDAVHNVEPKVGDALPWRVVSAGICSTGRGTMKFLFKRRACRRRRRRTACRRAQWCGPCRRFVTSLQGSRAFR